MSQVGLRRSSAIVLLFIVSAAGGLIVSGIVKMRAAAERTKCGNNLKQLALGVQAYHDTMSRLPPLVDLGERAPTGQGLPSVFATLIPFLEATPRQFRPGGSPEGYHAHSSTTFQFRGKGDREGDPWMTQSGGDANQFYSTFLCPSDATGERLRDVPMALPDGSTGYYAAGSYSANGLLPWNGAKFQLATSQKVLFGERPQVCRVATGETIYNLWGVGFYSPHLPAFATLAPGPESTGQAAPVVPLPETDEQLRVRVGIATAGPQVLDLAFPFQRITSSSVCDPRLPGTPHRDGLQAAMTDGSVRVFASDTSPRVFWTLCVPD